MYTKKISTCQNNPDLLPTTKINQHIPSGYSIYTSCSFNKSNNKLSYYRGEDCMRRFCKDLKDHAIKVIDCKKKDMIPLTKEEEDNYNKENICYICKKEFNKVKDHCHFTGKYRGAAHNMCNLRYKIPKNIPVIFHNGSTYDYHFIIKELACEFEGNFECLGENTEKHITFSVPIRKRVENKNIDITYKIKFIDSFRFMATSLSKLVDNLIENFHNDKCDKCKSSLCFVNAVNKVLAFECVDCGKEYKKGLNKKLIERFSNVYEFCGYDINKFMVLLRKGVYPYEYMDDEKKLPSKGSFYSSLTMEDISDTDYKHANNVFKKCNLNNLGDYHDLYVRSDTLLLADVFENFRNASLNNYELINKREKVGLNYFNDHKAFIEYSNDMQDVYKNIEDYNPIKKRKLLIVFDDMVADMISNNKLNPIVTELFIRGRKLNISIVFIRQSYFKVPKDVILNSTHFFILKIPNKRELQQIALNHSSDIDFKDFMNIY